MSAVAVPANCNVCGWKTQEPVRHIAGCLATWHVYETHPEAWASVAGDRQPRDPDPRIPEVRLQLELFGHRNMS